MRGVPPNFGPLETEAEALPAVVACFVGAVDPGAILLLGSRARGDARPDSDFDPWVVGKPSGALGSDDYEKVDWPPHGLGIGCDVVPCAAGDLEEGGWNLTPRSSRGSQGRGARFMKPLADERRGSSTASDLFGFAIGQ